MAIGLSFRQLMAVFGESLQVRQQQYNLELLMAKEGFNPTTKELLEGYRKAYPELSDSQLLMYFTNILAILDTISRNNESIAKFFPSK